MLGPSSKQEFSVGVIGYGVTGENGQSETRLIGCGGSVRFNSPARECLLRPREIMRDGARDGVLWSSVSDLFGVNEDPNPASFLENCFILM